MEVTKMRRKSSYSMGTSKCMRVRRTYRIHSWSSISGHVDDRCGRLIRCKRRTSEIDGGNSDTKGGCSYIEVGDSSGKRSERGSIKEIGEAGT